MITYILIYTCFYYSKVNGCTYEKQIKSDFIIAEFIYYCEISKEFAPPSQKTKTEAK